MYTGICIFALLLGCLMFFIPSFVKKRIKGAKLILLRITGAVLVILSIVFSYYLITDKITLPL